MSTQITHRKAVESIVEAAHDAQSDPAALCRLYADRFPDLQENDLLQAVRPYFGADWKPMVGAGKPDHAQPLTANPSTQNKPVK